MKAIRLLLIIFVFTAGLFWVNGVSAETDSEKLERLSQEIAEYTSKIQELRGKATTLAGEVAQFNANIALTELKIDKTQSQINLLGGRIDQLELSLTDLSDAFGSRVVETYKISRSGDPVFMVLAAKDVDKAISTQFYLEKIQEADNELLGKLENAQSTYKDQRTDLEVLEEELEEQTQVLSAQKSAKDSLLATTRNNEARYQDLLANARAEYEAIQAITAGKGTETEVGHVDAGQRIASIIQGSSCNSSGTHLHFIVSSGGNTQDPFNHLKSIDHVNCSGGGACSAGDSFNPSGSWEWPMSPRIHFTQGYGSTWAVANTWAGNIYSFHNGIDFDSESSSEVKAVQSGTLYRGSFSGSGGCNLRYVRVDHDESDLDTFYLHINY